MSGKALFSRKGRRAAALGAAGLGACAVLAACAPVQIGAAAIVGNQRITQNSLDEQVSNWQAAAKPFGSVITLSKTAVPQAVLSWMIRFQIMNQVAATNGITVTQADAQTALASLGSVAGQDGYRSVTELLVANGLPPQMFGQLGQWEAQEQAYARQHNGGKDPATTAEQAAFTKAINSAQCSAAKSLDIKVSPQYGRFNYAATSFAVVSAANTLSQPAGKPTAVSTQGLTPAAC